MLCYGVVARARFDLGSERYQFDTPGATKPRGALKVQVVSSCGLYDRDAPGEAEFQGFRHSPFVVDVNNKQGIKAHADIGLRTGPPPPVDDVWVSGGAM